MKNNLNGANIENVVIDSIRMENLDMPIFMRLGERGLVYRDAEQRPVGSINNVSISNVTATARSLDESRIVPPSGIFLTGTPNHKIGNVKLSNIEIKLPGGGKKEDAQKVVPENETMYPEDQIELPPSYMAQHPFDNGHMVLRNEELAEWPRTPEIARKELSDYYAIITHLDAQIGRVIQALKESGQYENTIIILSGDSGLAVGCHGLMGKQSVYNEDGIHVPFILSGNLIPDHGRVIDSYCYIHDIFPTICDLAGIQKPASIDGKSMVPVIMNEKKQVRGSRVTQLFNIKEDMWETTDLSFFPQYQEKVKTMRAEMKAKAVELEDKKENTGVDYDFWDYYE